MVDFVLRDVEPEGEYGIDDIADVIVQRIGLKRKESRANHAKLLVELLRFRKNNFPLQVDEIARILEVSVPQAYEELRKWKSLGLVEVVKIKNEDSYIRGYMLSSQTANKLIDKVESRLKTFIKKTRRIAKELDDYIATERLGKS